PFVAVDPEEPLGELDRFAHRRRFEDRESADHLLGLGERSIDGGQLPCAQPYAGTLGSRPQPGGADQLALAGHLVDQPAHVGHELLARYETAVLVHTDHRQNSHDSSPVDGREARPLSLVEWEGRKSTRAAWPHHRT